jgi:hypothetical protein
MHNLELSIAEWRKDMAAAPRLGPEALDELESHLRETVDQLMRSGAGEAEAFQRAVEQMGPPQTVAAEFQKLRPAPLWLPIKIVGVLLGVLAALVLAFVLSVPMHRKLDMLLTLHVMTLSVGYATTLLLGFLGVCFVCQRCVAELPARRLAQLPPFSSTFAILATLFTVVGVMLGMLWSKQQWGRYWSWDAREIGGLCVLGWLLAFVAAHRVRLMTPRALFMMSVLSCSVVSLAWLGPNLSSGSLHSYGMPSQVSKVLSVALMGNLLFFLLGFAPTECLRRRRA